MSKAEYRIEVLEYQVELLSKFVAFIACGHIKPVDFNKSLSDAIVKQGEDDPLATFLLAVATHVKKLS